MKTTITAAQCRAARALLEITQEALAEASGLPVRTIAAFESGGTDKPRAATFAAIIGTFSERGIMFVDSTNVTGVLLMINAP